MEHSKQRSCGRWSAMDRNPLCNIDAKDKMADDAWLRRVHHHEWPSSLASNSFPCVPRTAADSFSARHCQRCEIGGSWLVAKLLSLLAEKTVKKLAQADRSRAQVLWKSTSLVLGTGIRWRTSGFQVQVNRGFLVSTGGPPEFRPPVARGIQHSAFKIATERSLCVPVPQIISTSRTTS